MEENVKLSSPWEQVHHALTAFFNSDSDIEVAEEINYDNYTLEVSVKNPDKYIALSRVLKTEYDFGNVKFVINLKLDISNCAGIAVQDIETVLRDNDLFARIENGQMVPGIDNSFCVFKKQVVQYFDDNACDMHGLKSTLAEDIAKDIFDLNGEEGSLQFTTDSNDIN